MKKKILGVCFKLYIGYSIVMDFFVVAGILYLIFGG